MVVPVSPKFDNYANIVSVNVHPTALPAHLLLQVYKQLWEAGFQVETDLAPGDTMNKKIRNAQLSQFNFILGV